MKEGRRREGKKGGRETELAYLLTILTFLSFIRNVFLPLALYPTDTLNLDEDAHQNAPPSLAHDWLKEYI